MNTKSRNGSWKQFQREGLVTDDGPIVAVNANSGNPHYEPRRNRLSAHQQGDLVLLDIWAS